MYYKRCSSEYRDHWYYVMKNHLSFEMAMNIACVH